MSDPALGLTMLGLIVVAIMLGFPTAFTLMGLGMGFGFFALHEAGHPWLENRIFDLMVQRTYGAMVNETLLSIPLFVLMGYVMERGALVDKMFHSVRLAFRRVPGSLAVTTLIICTFWGIASGLVGAVVVLMGVIAMRPMLDAGYDVRLASGVITAGGTLGILIPPSVMIIVYAAVAGESVVKLYAAAMFPGFFLAALYLVYVLGWAILRPEVAPKLPLEETRAAVTPPVAHLARTYSPNLLIAYAMAFFAPGRAQRGEVKVSWGQIANGFIVALVPFLLAAVCLGGAWWYVTIKSQEVTTISMPTMEQTDAAQAAAQSSGLSEPPSGGLSEPPVQGGLSEPPSAEPRPAPEAKSTGPEVVQELGEHVQAQAAPPVPPIFYPSFWGTCLVIALLLVWYYRNLDGEQFEILRMLVSSVMPLTILTLLVLGVILFGITTATESAALGAAGAFVMAWQAKTLNWQRTKEAVFLTMKTTAMVCWLFVGSALFSAVFAILGGQALVEHWVIGLELSSVQFLLVSQAIIFVLGWPLEWTEIIVIFIPIFLPLLKHFDIDPLLFGTLIFVNLQAAFLSPPVAMSAFYLKGVSPPHVTINQIFAGMMPYMLIVILCMIIMYLWPGLTLWLPNYLYT